MELTAFEILKKIKKHKLITKQNSSSQLTFKVGGETGPNVLTIDCDELRTMPVNKESNAMFTNDFRLEICPDSSCPDYMESVPYLLTRLIPSFPTRKFDFTLLEWIQFLALNRFKSTRFHTLNKTLYNLRVKTSSASMGLSIDQDVFTSLKNSVSKNSPEMLTCKTITVISPSKKLVPFKGMLYVCVHCVCSSSPEESFNGLNEEMRRFTNLILEHVQGFEFGEPSIP